MAGQASRRWRVDVCAAACIHDPLDDVGLEPLQEQVLREVGVGRETNDAADELGVRLGEPDGYPSTDPSTCAHINQRVGCTKSFRSDDAAVLNPADAP